MQLHQQYRRQAQKTLRKAAGGKDEVDERGEESSELSNDGSKKKPAVRKKPASKNPGRGRGRARGSTGRGRGKVETKKRKENEPKSEAKTKKPKKDCLINLRAYSHQRIN